MPPDVSDEHLVNQAQQGSQDAFLTLYNRYLKIVLNRVKSRVPQEDVEDVTQEIFISVVRSLHTFENRSRFSTWLYTIVNRHIADFYRRRKRKHHNQMVALENSEAYITTGESTHLDEKVDIRAVIQELPEHYQDVILMRFADGLTFAEIARQKNKSLDAIKSLYRRAIRAISDQVGYCDQK